MDLIQYSQIQIQRKTKTLKFGIWYALSYDYARKQFRLKSKFYNELIVMHLALAYAIRAVKQKHHLI